MRALEEETMNTGFPQDTEIVGWCPAEPVLPHEEKVPL